MESVNAAKDFLLWCRETGIQVGRLRVGDLEIELADLVQGKQLAEELAAQQATQSWKPEAVPEAEHIYAHLADSVGRADLADRGES